MKRKLVEQGKTTLMISLPVSWIKRFGLKKGDEIELEEQSDSLFILPHKARHKERTIQIEKQAGLSLERQLASFYENGFDKIEIRSQNKEILEAISKYLDHFIGFEITETGKDFCVIRSIVDISEQEFETVLRRLILQVLDMGETFSEILEKKEYKRAGEITSRLMAIDKLSYLCMRLLNKKGHKEYEKAVHLYNLIRYLKRIADDFNLVKLRLFVGMGRPSLSEDPSLIWQSEREVSIPKNMKLAKEALNCFRDTVDLLKGFYELFYNWNEEKFLELLEKRKPIRYYPYKRKNFSSYDIYLLSCGISVSELVLEMMRDSLSLRLTKE